MGAPGRTIISSSKAARLGAALLWTALMASACDSDEIKPAGTAGSAGSAGSGGNTSGAGKTGAGAETGDGGDPGQPQGGGDGLGGADSNAGGAGEDPANRLGRPCLSDPDCQAPGQAALTCVKPTDTVLGGGAPPHGLCTLSCQSHLECDERSPGSICYPFDEAAPNGYCIEACEFGPTALGTQKCQNRADFVCAPAGLVDTGTACTNAGGCLAGEVCSGGTCLLVFPGCLPSCRGDLDCATGMFCDQSFNSGVCVPEEPTGKGLGEPCTVADEPDECLGFCRADAAGATTGHCATTCSVGTGCSWNSESELFDGACFLPSATAGPNATVGDFGYCVPTCNCSADCDDAELGCALLTQGALPPAFRGPGLCFAGLEPEEEIDLCGGGGAPSSGGAPNGNGGAGGGL